MKIWVIAIILFLSGCASTVSYEAAKADSYKAIKACRDANLVPMLNENGSISKTIDGKPVMKPKEGACAAEYAAYQKNLDAIERRDAKRAPKCPKGMGILKSGPFGDGGCVSNDTLRQILRKYGL